MATKLFDSTVIRQTQEAQEFLANVLESSTEYSIIGKDLDGKILLWNEGARRMYGYDADEVIGKANSDILHTPEDVARGLPLEMRETALRDGKWEGVIGRLRKDKRRFSARVVITPRRDLSGKPIGFLLISKDISNELRFTEELRKAKLFDSAIVGNAQEAVDFITNILESSTEYSVIGKDLDGESGFDLARRAMPALIICDIGLPKMDGFAVAAQLKSRPALREIPLVAVTALAMVGDRDKVLAAGFDGYIAKPIAPETFVSQVEKFLRADQRPTKRPVAPIPSEQVAPMQSYRGTILAVDNVGANLELDKSILEPFGYHVIAAKDMQQALELARQKHPDLIMSDLHMPGNDGFELVKAVRQDPQLRHMIIVIHSASMMSKRDGERALELGADKFIMRPMEPQVLLEEIEACFKTRSV